MKTPIRLLSLFVFLYLCCLNSISTAQGILKPGFDKRIYQEFLRLHAGIYDTMGVAKLPPPTFSKLVYRSPTVGLDNRWDLWKTKEGLLIINLRGTTKSDVGWLENLYAAMVPATGELKLTKDFTFKYKLANNPRATVHVGFLIGVAFLSGDILNKIDSCYKSGSKDFLIAGHSQGGALSFLLTAYLHQLQNDHHIPTDIRFKTFASAAPKTGNSYFAYEYENLAAGGWAFNIVNAVDWVPETPFSVQTIADFNTANPFYDVDKIVKKQKFFARIAIRHGYKQLRKPSERAQRNYKKYLGGFVEKLVKKKSA